MVATVPEAMPKYRLSTDPMIALIFGEEKRAKPKPRTSKTMTISQTGVAGESAAKTASPAAVIAIPIEASTLGSFLSESFPAQGENSAITTG